MMFVGILLALVLALLFVAIFSVGFGRPGPWGSALWFFLVVFLGTVAVAAWSEPVGPLVMGVAWLPSFVAALFLALLLAAATPVRKATAGAGGAGPAGDPAVPGRLARRRTGAQLPAPAPQPLLPEPPCPERRPSAEPRPPPS